MTALVTGCAGFIGSHLTESLLADGQTVLGVDCFNDNYGRAQKLKNLERAMDWDGFQFLPLDLARGDLFDLMDECEVVFHLAAEPGVRPSWGKRFAQYVSNNVLATQHLLEAARVGSPKRFVYASSSSVYGQVHQLPIAEDIVPRPHSPYGATKLSGEHLCDLYQANFAVNAISLRFFTVYGPRQRPDMAFNTFIRCALEGKPIPLFGDGRQTRDFTYVDDVVTAVRLAGRTDRGAISGPLNVAGGSQVSVADVLTLLGDLCGRDLEILHHDQQRGDVKDTRADTSRIRDQLKFVPAVPLERGLAAQLEWTEELLSADPGGNALNVPTRRRPHGA